MADETGKLLAETLIQDTHITHEPTTQPSTSADAVHPVPSNLDLDVDLDSDDGGASISSSILDRPSSALGTYYPHGRRQPMPPLPDLRFEQSYLASIAPAKGVWWKIALITLKDQVALAFMQGFGFKIITLGWRRWNSAVRFAGNGMGGEFASYVF